MNQTGAAAETTVKRSAAFVTRRADELDFDDWAALMTEFADGGALRRVEDIDYDPFSFVVIITWNDGTRRRYHQRCLFKVKARQLSS